MASYSFLGNSATNFVCQNINHAKGGCVMAAALKLLPLFTLVMPGMAARILFKNEVPKYCVIRSIIGTMNNYIK